MIGVLPTQAIYGAWRELSVGVAPICRIAAVIDGMERCGYTARANPTNNLVAVLAAYAQRDARNEQKILEIYDNNIQQTRLSCSLDLFNSMQWINRAMLLVRGLTRTDGYYVPATGLAQLVHSHHGDACAISSYGDEGFLSAKVEQAGRRIVLSFYPDPENQDGEQQYVTIESDVPRLPSGIYHLWGTPSSGYRIGRSESAYDSEQAVMSWRLQYDEDNDLPIITPAQRILRDHWLSSNADVDAHTLCNQQGECSWEIGYMSNTQVQRLENDRVFMVVRKDISDSLRGYCLEKVRYDGECCLVTSRVGNIFKVSTSPLGFGVFSHSRDPECFFSPDHRYIICSSGDIFQAARGTLVGRLLRPLEQSDKFIIDLHWLDETRVGYVVATREQHDDIVLERRCTTLFRRPSIDQER